MEGKIVQFFFRKCIYFWLGWAFVAACGLRLWSAGSLFFTAVHGLLIESLLLLWSAGSRHTGFSSCRRQAQKLLLSGSAVAACGPSSAKVAGSVAAASGF